MGEDTEVPRLSLLPLSAFQMHIVWNINLRGAQTDALLKQVLLILNWEHLS